jgi:WD40 repeat protein
VERLLKWGRRHPALAGLIALLLLALLGGASGVIWQWRQAESARRGEAFERRRAEEALARSSVALAESAIRDGNTPAARAALEAVPAEWRNATWHYLLGESDTSRSLASIGLQTVDDIAGDPSRPSVFAAAQRSGQIVLFDVRTQSRLLEFTPGFTNAISNAVLRLAFSRDGQRIVVGRKNGAGGLVIHNAHDGRKLGGWDAPESERLEFSPDATMILQSTVARISTVLWNAVDGTLRWKHKEGLNSAVFASNPHQVVHYTWGRQLHLAAVEDGAIQSRLATSGYFDNFALQPGGDVLAAANPLGFVRGYSLTNGQQCFEFQPHEGAIEYLAFLPGGERFLTAAKLQDGRQALQCWESRNGRACQTLTGGHGNIRAIALHPLSGELIVCGQEIRIWDVATLPPIRTIHCGNAHPSAVFWGDDETIFAPRDGGESSAHLWSHLSGARTLLWTSPDPGLGQPSVSADGRRAAIGRYNSAALIQVLEREGGTIQQIASLNPRCSISHVRISPNGDRVAIVQSDLGRLFIVDVATNKRGVQLEVPDVTGFSDVAWLESGAYLAGLVTTRAPRSTPGSVEQIVLWDMATGRRVHSVTNATVPRVACAAPDGRRFAEAGANRNVRIRDGATLGVVREMRVHNAPITALAWHPTRPILATASEDLVIRLWDLDTGARLEELRGPLSPPSVLSFTPGGARLATAARDRVVRIWEPRSLAPQTAQK